MAQPQPKSKLEQFLKDATAFATWLKGALMWAVGVAGAVVIASTLAGEYGLSSQYVPTMAWQSLGWAGVAYFGFNR